MPRICEEEQQLGGAGSQYRKQRHSSTSGEETKGRKKTNKKRFAFIWWILRPVNRSKRRRSSCVSRTLGSSCRSASLRLPSGASLVSAACGSASLVAAAAAAATTAEQKDKKERILCPECLNLCFKKSRTVSIAMEEGETGREKFGGRGSHN